MIDGTVAEHFKILRGVLRLRVGAGLVPGIGHAHLAPAMHPLLESKLKRMVVGIESRFQSIDGSPAIIGPNGVDAGDIRGGKDRRVRSSGGGGMQSGC